MTSNKVKSSYSEFKRINADALLEKFSQLSYAQLHEYEDFCELEFRKQARRSEVSEGMSP